MSADYESNPIFNTVDWSKDTIDLDLNSILTILTGEQRKWFSDNYMNIFVPLFSDGGKQINKHIGKNFKTWDVEGIKLEIFFNVLDEMGNRNIDFYLNFLLYCKVFAPDTQPFPEGNITFFSKEHDCYYCKPDSESPMLEDFDPKTEEDGTIVINVSRDKEYFIFSDTLTDFKKSFDVLVDYRESSIKKLIRHIFI